jgi:hypothetical protein
MRLRSVDKQFLDESVYFKGWLFRGVNDGASFAKADARGTVDMALVLESLEDVLACLEEAFGAAHATLRWFYLCMKSEKTLVSTRSFWETLLGLLSRCPSLEEVRISCRQVVKFPSICLPKLRVLKLSKCTLSGLTFSDALMPALTELVLEQVRVLASPKLKICSTSLEKLRMLGVFGKPVYVQAPNLASIFVNSVSFCCDLGATERLRTMNIQGGVDLKFLSPPMVLQHVRIYRGTLDQFQQILPGLRHVRMLNLGNVMGVRFTSLGSLLRNVEELIVDGRYMLNGVDGVPTGPEQGFTVLKRLVVDCRFLSIVNTEMAESIVEKAEG